MAFPGHLSHEMSMPHLGADDAAAAAAVAAGAGGGGPPAWLRYGDGSFLHLQTTSDSSASPSAAAAAAAAAEADAARCKAEVLAHPVYEQLLSAHVACLRIATPVDQLPRIDAQLTQSQGVVAQYSGGLGGAAVGDDGRELDQFMLRTAIHDTCLSAPSRRIVALPPFHCCLDCLGIGGWWRQIDYGMRVPALL
ncbi:unnamed protein product [Urochloa humidicola]